MTIKYILIICVVLTGFRVHSQSSGDFPKNNVVPSAEQIAYQKMEVIGFIHFGVNTFTDREWGTGTEDPKIFNPSSLDVNQWVSSAKKAGMGMLIITAKHHDGFCLWPSEYTDHSVASSPWEDGKGDIVKDLSEACAKEGIKMGIYLSPWDMHEPLYGTDSYNQYYLNQLRELMNNYGTISEVWMDGAKGKNVKDMEYDFEKYRSTIYELQPGALIFSDAGPDIRWIGNEHGIAGKTNWSMLVKDDIQIGKADTDYLNTGDPDGTSWVVGECDVSIRPGWFYHAAQDSKVKSAAKLTDLYYKSVGRNGTFLLNIPPDKRGLWHENDVQELIEFKSILDETFSNNLALNKKVIVSGTWNAEEKYQAANITDEDMSSFWAASEDEEILVITIELGRKEEFDRIMLQEPIGYGQRISAFSIEVKSGKKWKQVAEGTTIGYKRLLRINKIKSDELRIHLTSYNNTPAISNFGLYLASERETVIKE